MQMVGHFTTAPLMVSMPNNRSQYGAKDFGSTHHSLLA